MTDHYSNTKSGAVTSTNLDAVTSATNGSKLGVRDFKDKTVFVEVTSNTGAVTVTIEASPDGTTWYELASKTYTATNDKDVFSYTDHFPFMRVTTSTHANATVSAEITGGSC